MKETIRDLMTVDCRSRRSGDDDHGGIVPADGGEILVGSASLSEIAARELVAADHQQDLDDAQRLQSRRRAVLHPVVAECDKQVGHIVWSAVASHMFDRRCRDAVEGVSG